MHWRTDRYAQTQTGRENIRRPRYVYANIFDLQNHLFLQYVSSLFKKYSNSSSLYCSSNNFTQLEAWL